MRTLLPRQGVPIADGGGMASNPFYAFLQDVERAVNSGVAGGEGLTDAITAIARALGSPDGSVANIPEQPQGGGQILGPQSVHVNGALPNMVQIVLEGDAADPGPTFRYGTDAEGAKGWFPIADALAGSDTATLTVGADGVVTFSLPELPNTGGGALQKTQRDGYGRLAGTSEATTTDLTEGDNLYFTDERAQAAVATQSITAGDTTHAPSGGAVFAALASAGIVRAAGASSGASQPLATGVAQKVLLANEEYDNDDMYSPTTSRCTPKRPGLYAVVGAVKLATVAAGGARLIVQCSLNGGGASSITTGASNSPSNTIQHTLIARMNGTTDYVELVARQDTGSAATISADAATRLDVIFLGPLS